MWGESNEHHISVREYPPQVLKIEGKLEKHRLCKHKGPANGGLLRAVGEMKVTIVLLFKYM